MKEKILQALTTLEVWDFIFSVVGVLAGVLNVLLARLVFHFIV